MRLGMVINLIKCTGCYSCVIKCKEEHLLPPGMTWAKLLISETGTSPCVTKQMYPVLCNHCKEPACAKACPTGATQQDDNGKVWVYQDKCVGCRYCLVACPYQVPTYYAKAKDFCDVDGPESEVLMLISGRRAVQLHPEYGTDPSIYYIIG